MVSWGVVVAMVSPQRYHGGRAVTLPVAPDLLDALHDALAWRKNNKPKEDYILPQIADCYKPLEDGAANPRANGIQIGHEDYPVCHGA